MKNENRIMTNQEIVELFEKLAKENDLHISFENLNIDGTYQNGKAFIKITGNKTCN